VTQAQATKFGPGSGKPVCAQRSARALESGRLHMSGFVTWLVWVLVHLISLPQLQNRLRVRTQWFLSYYAGQRSSRLIPELPSAETGEPGH
jgi:NADH dehydrogenase